MESFDAPLPTTHSPLLTNHLNMAKRRLLRLELQGYKTFASKTEFQFGEGITAIIGPNGSGKSNIADGLRWVMGEQSFSMLRGKKTDDMIFAGSEQRARSSMASSTIVFDNSDQWLPLEFSEISITRRAYRNGPNEYLINGKKARLRDISDLLGKVGLSQRNYTIIGQGLIDNALSLKADDRRALFEEAAGIGVYRNKRQDALKKLDQTARNLERIEDVLTEVKPRLRALERQAKRARQYNELRSELMSLLRVWYGYKWFAVAEAVETARETALTNEVDLQKLQTDQTAIDSRLNGLRETINSLRAQINSWRRETSRQHGEREAITRNLAVSEERIRSLDEQRESVTSEIIQLEASVQSYNTRLKDMDAEVQRLQAERNEARSKVDEIEAQRRALASERRKMTERQQQVRRKVNIFTQKLTEQQGRRKALLSRQDRLKQDRQRVKTELENAEVKVSQLQRLVDSATNTLVEAQSKRKQIQVTLQDITEKMSLVDQQRNNMGSEIAQALGKVERLVARQEILAQQRESGNAGAGQQQLRSAAKSGKLAGYQDELTTLLQTPPEYDVAIAAALGSTLTAAVVNNNKTIEDALQVLVKGGQATLLPLDQLRPPEVIGVPKYGDGIGWASAMVSCEPQYRPVIDTLLGRVLLCQTRSGAREASQSLPHGAMAVSLTGEVFRADGIVVIGKSAGAKTLELERELRGLPKKITAAKTIHTQLLSQSDKLKADREQLNLQQRKLRESSTEAQRAEQKAQKERDAAQLNVERAKSNTQFQQRQADNIERDLQGITKTVKSIDTEVEELTESRKKAEHEARVLAAELLKLDSDDLSAKIAGWQTNLAVAAQALKGAANQKSEVQSNLQSSQSQLGHRKQRQGQLETERNSLETRINDMRGQDSKYQATLDELRALRNPAEQKLTGLEANLAEAERAESSGRGVLHAAERKNASAQLDYQRRQDELENLKRQILDDFGVIDELEDTPEPEPETVTGVVAPEAAVENAAQPVVAEGEQSEAADVETVAPEEPAEPPVDPTVLAIENIIEHLERVDEAPAGIEKQIREKRIGLRKMGAINQDAQIEYDEVKDRHDDLMTQIDDLNQASDSLKEIIGELDALMDREFRATFEAVSREFTKAFKRLFNGGTAELKMTNPDDVTTTGIEITAQLPGKRMQGLDLLSGGERSLTACALIFALLSTSPTPFALMDEVDAMLDESNVGRFRDMLDELSSRTQFLVITHNRNTVEVADTVYGVSMKADSTSTIISLRLDGDNVAKNSKEMSLLKQ